MHPVIVARGVLVVEDSHVQRLAVIGLLRKLGIGVIYEACDGREALAEALARVTE